MSKETVEHNINVPVEEEKGSTKKLQFSFLNGTFEDEDTGLKGDFTVGGHLIINLEDGRQYNVSLEEVCTAVINQIASK